MNKKVNNLNNIFLISILLVASGFVIGWIWILFILSFTTYGKHVEETGGGMIAAGGAVFLFLIVLMFYCVILLFSVAISSISLIKFKSEQNKICRIIYIILFILGIIFIITLIVRFILMFVLKIW